MNKLQKNIPNHWKWVTLDDIGIVVSGGTPSTKEPEFWNGDIAWITPADLSNYNDVYISGGKRKISNIGLDYSSATLLPKNSIVFSSRAPIGYVAITKNELATNQGFKNLILPSILVNPKYVYYYLKTVKELTENMASGTTFLELSATKFKQVPFPLAPIEEQNRIVDKIEELLSELEKSKDELNGILKTIEKQRKNIINKSLINETKPIYITLEEVSTKITDGTHHTPKYTNSGIHFISVKDIKKGEIDFTNTRFISEEEHNKLVKRCNPEFGDVLITKSGTIGRLAIVPENKKFSLFVSVALIKVDKEKINERYLLYCLENFINSINIKEDIKGAVQKNFHLEDLRATKIPYCEIIDQLKIAHKIDFELNNLQELETNISESIMQNKYLYDKILNDAFQGKLSQQYKTDLSVELLLIEISKLKEEYIENQIKTKKSKTKNIKMAKKKLSIIEVLKKYKEPISAENLWQESKHEKIDDFYENLKEIEHLITQDISKKPVKISLK
ncbi:restriction endonuclease subunit S [Flavobacterium columnare]|uniref:restriction endonuclease subunit S n=1 Tax=Flavobacterium columnare TaxID=996 RepID=UPI003C2E1ABC